MLHAICLTLLLSRSLYGDSSLGHSRGVHAETNERGKCILDGECYQHAELGGGVPQRLVAQDDSDFAYQHWGVGTSAESCLARARQWHTFCGNPNTSPITATFLPTSDRYTYPEASQHGAALDPTLRQEWVLLLQVTDGYMDFLHNFLAWYMKIEKWSVQHAVKVVVSSDAAAKEIASEYGPLHIEVVVGLYYGHRPLGYNDKGFTSFVQKRPSLILQELLADRNVLYLDVDVVLLADPFPSLTPGYDIWTAMDHPHTHCTGILAMSPSRRTIDFLSDWESAFQDTKEAKRPIGNQEAFNDAVQAVDNAHLNILKLSQQQFPPGSLYFAVETDKGGLDRAKVLAVHNNFIVGHAAKKKRFLDYGLWIERGFESKRRRDAAGGGSVGGGMGMGDERSGRADDERIKHPDDEPVTIMFLSLTAANIKFAIEEAGVLAVHVSGAVDRCSYLLQWTIFEFDSNVKAPLYAGIVHFNLSSSTMNLTIPARSVTFVGRAEVQVYVSDGFPGLSPDDAFLSGKRRAIEFWSQGCRCSVVWPLPRRSNGSDGKLAASKKYGCEEPPWTRNGRAGDDVTLATISSISRLPLVLTVAHLWDAPMSVALYARTPVEEGALEGLLHGDLYGVLSQRQHLRIVLVSPCYMDEKDTSIYTLPINVLRHHAVASAGTDLVFYIDVDFLPSADAASQIRKHAAAMDLRSEVLVVPCFKHAQASRSMRWPQVVAIARGEHWWSSNASSSSPFHSVQVSAPEVALSDLLEHVRHARIVSAGAQHAPTDYPQWLRGAALGEAWWTGGRHDSYPVSYALGWEPYIVINKTSWRGLNTEGLFDQRFRERGWNKAAFVYEVAARGFRFRTLHRVFLMHAPDAGLASCPEAFGSRFCSIFDKTPNQGWVYADRSRELFASFIRDVSQRQGTSSTGSGGMGCGNSFALDSEACDAGGLGLGAQSGGGGASEVPDLYLHHHLYLPAAVDSWCLVYPFHVMKGLQADVIDGFLSEAYDALALQLQELGSKLASSCAHAGSTSGGTNGCKNMTHSDLVSDWFTRSDGWKGFFDWWCVSVPALVGTVRQIGDGGEGLLLRVDSRIWESWSGPDTFRFLHYIAGMNGVLPMVRVQIHDFGVLLKAEVRLGEYCVEMMDQEHLWQCTIKTVMQDKDGNAVAQLSRKSVLLELVQDAEESPSELRSQLARMEVALFDELRRRRAAEDRLEQGWHQGHSSLADLDPARISRLP